MKTKQLLAIVLLAIIFVSGCDLISNALSDINGWDISSCYEEDNGPTVCFNLLFDNRNQILGGANAVNSLFGID